MKGEYSRAQSEVIGVVFLTAVIVVLTVIVGAVILGSVDTQRDPTANLEVTAGESNLTITHLGGSTFSEDEVTVILRSGSEDRRRLSTFHEQQGNGDDRFQPGERFTAVHGVIDSVRVLIVHEPSNTVQYDRSFDVPETAVPQLRWGSRSDWDAAVDESTVLHQSFGDHHDDRIELGYPPTESGLLAYWPLDEDNGTTAVDATGNGNDGTIENATLGSGGIFGTTSYRFDSGAEAHVADATHLSALRNTASLSVWIKTTQTGNDTMYEAPGITGVESAGDGNDIFWGWLNANGQIGVQAGDNPGAISSTTVADGDWHHVVLTREASSGDVEVYVDGTLEGTATSRSGTITTTFGSIGRIEDTAGTSEYFDGRIEELRVYDRVLTGEEVSALWDNYTDGALTTPAKQFAEAVDPTLLNLSGVRATVPTNGDVSVYVESDPENDGTFVRSDEIVLDGSGSYEVTGLSAASKTYRLRIELEARTIVAGPTFRSARLESS